jgi:hypothetical protein
LLFSSDGAVLSTCRPGIAARCVEHIADALHIDMLHLEGMTVTQLFDFGHRSGCC